ncbi:hypothetical protein AVEN_12447-1 [Araneus ventricosus]|uniref:Uncharacterized protein n=1 Tax=Araneus ventricosus TaxID=182803 RepID=A0A4Y2MC83_ARAVE|nr:hypothetical protein AVEN_12447-1 [Araneus ventricosus]
MYLIPETNMFFYRPCRDGDLALSSKNKSPQPEPRSTHILDYISDPFLFLIKLALIGRHFRNNEEVQLAVELTSLAGHRFLTGWFLNLISLPSK